MYFKMIVILQQTHKSLNGKGWKGPLGMIYPKSSAKVGSPRSSDPGLHPQSIWGACSYTPCKEFFPHIHETVFQLMPIATCLISGHH